jgi:hypothetical protein
VKGSRARPDSWRHASGLITPIPPPSLGGDPAVSLSTDPIATPAVAEHTFRLSCRRARAFPEPGLDLETLNRLLES